MRGILDGHLILSREIAAKNQYPAIDVLGSLSRVMSQIVSAEQRQYAGQPRRLLAKYNEVETLLQVGEYRQGSDAVADEAIARIDAIRDFLSQSTDQLSDYDATLEQLAGVIDDA